LFPLPFSLLKIQIPYNQIAFCRVKNGKSFVNRGKQYVSALLAKNGIIAISGIRLAAELGKSLPKKYWHRACNM
jgi:hypothetical protein